jgi:hypothetical protein
MSQDGVQDPDEFGMGGIPVYLYADDGDGVFEPEGDDLLVATTVTLDEWENPAHGTYHFTNVVPGQYWVTIDPMGWLVTTPDPHPLIDLQPAEVYSDADFGLTSGGG